MNYDNKHTHARPTAQAHHLDGPVFCGLAGYALSGSLPALSESGSREEAEYPPLQSGHRAVTYPTKGKLR